MWFKSLTLFFALSFATVPHSHTPFPTEIPSVASTSANSTSSTISPPGRISNIGCWHGGQCKYDYRDRKMMITAPYVGDLEAQMEWCYLKCSGDPACMHFNVHMVRGKPFCYLLKECKEFSTVDVCVAEKKCNSGPKNCTSNMSCPRLTHVPNTMKWRCDHNVNPYEQQAYDKARCFLSCNAWKDANGTQVVVVSKCISGIWTTSTILPNKVLASDVAALPNPLPQPDVIGDQTACGCADYDMAWNGTIDYDPNSLPGTALICTGGNLVTDDGTNYKFILKPKMICRLFCDSYYVTTMACVNGHWTGKPELGAWCYMAPSEENDMGPVIEEA